jgi:hypothetical protein
MLTRLPPCQLVAPLQFAAPQAVRMICPDPIRIDDRTLDRRRLALELRSELFRGETASTSIRAKRGECTVDSGVARQVHEMSAGEFRCPGARCGDIDDGPSIGIRSVATQRMPTPPSRPLQSTCACSQEACARRAPH